MNPRRECEYPSECKHTGIIAPCLSPGNRAYLKLSEDIGRDTRHDNAIGINPDLNEIQERVVEKEDYDILLLCSDGLYNAVSEDRIAEILASMEEAPILARKLIDEALLNRGTDNIAVSLWENF